MIRARWLLNGRVGVRVYEDEDGYLYASRSLAEAREQPPTQHVREWLRWLDERAQQDRDVREPVPAEERRRPVQRGRPADRGEGTTDERRQWAPETRVRDVA